MSKAKTFTESGVHTLIVPEATESERGTYICRAVNAYGYVDTAATIEIISPGAIDGGKPAMFVSRPSEKSIAVAIGEDVSVSFRVTGVPKPRGNKKQLFQIELNVSQRVFKYLCNNDLSDINDLS